MTLGFMKKGTKQSWDEIPTPDTVIVRVNTLAKGQPNDLDFLDSNNHPVGD